MRQPPDHVREIQVEGYRAMSAERKLELAFSLRDAAWELVRAGVRRRHPGYSDAELEAEVRRLFANAAT